MFAFPEVSDLLRERGWTSSANLAAWLLDTVHLAVVPGEAFRTRLDTSACASPSTTALTVGATRVEVSGLHRSGTGTSLVFLHGFGSTKGDYADVVQQTALADRPVLASPAHSGAAVRTGPWRRRHNGLGRAEAQAGSPLLGANRYSLQPSTPTGAGVQ